ncbi:MAG: hypothetical protein F4158_04725 [Synechococcus sp. SB0675_bin_7]|nr:hypothetical protein [Synechococcus sp. SB0675_bin_7]
MPIPALPRNVSPRGETTSERVHYKLKASPNAAKRMDDLAESLGTTASVLISSGIDVYYEILKQLLDQGGGKLYIEDLQGKRTEVKVIDD